jgi:hypothetical protein
MIGYFSENKNIEKREVRKAGHKLPGLIYTEVYLHPALQFIPAQFLPFSAHSFSLNTLVHFLT